MQKANFIFLIIPFQIQVNIFMWVCVSLLTVLPLKRGRLVLLFWNGRSTIQPSFVQKRCWKLVLEVDFVEWCWKALWMIAISSWVIIVMKWRNIFWEISIEVMIFGKYNSYDRPRSVWANWKTSSPSNDCWFLQLLKRSYSESRSGYSICNWRCKEYTMSIKYRHLTLLLWMVSWISLILHSKKAEVKH